MNDLNRAAPAAQGVRPEGILAFLDELERQQQELHSLMVLRHGQVVAEGWWRPFSPGQPHILQSLQKIFTSAAVGLAIEAGLLDLDTPLLHYFPEKLTEETQKSTGGLTVRHMITGTTGQGGAYGRMGGEPLFLRGNAQLLFGERADGDLVQNFLEWPCEKEPGTFFSYSPPASHLLILLVERVTGMPFLDWLEPRVFAPLGIEKPAWVPGSQGKNCIWHLAMKTGDLARFGQMLLQKGMWNGQRILPEAWITEATRKQADTAETMQAMGPDYQLGYGFQFWPCRHGAYRGDGALGQFCIVMPEQDAVVVITAGVRSSQAVLDAVWDHLLPAMADGPLPENPAAASALAQRLAGLALGEAGGTAPAEALDGVKKYRLAPNAFDVDTVIFSCGEQDCYFSWRDATGQYAVTAGMGVWNAENRLDGEVVGARGVWHGDDTFVLEVCGVLVPSHHRLACAFAGDTLEMAYKDSINGAESRLKGKLCAT